MATNNTRHSYILDKTLISIDESDSIVKEQVYLNTLPPENPAVEYFNTRFISADQKNLFFYVDNLYEWIQKYVYLDEDTENYIKNIKTISYIKNNSRIFDGPDKMFDNLKQTQCMGHFGRNASGEITSVLLRTITNSGVNKIGKLYLKFFRTKDEKKIILFRTITPYSFNNLEVLQFLRNHYWETISKNKLDLDQPIVVTEGGYDSLFLNNSISCCGIMPGMVIPETLKNKNLIFVFNNNLHNGIYRVSTNLLRMGYTIFSWPKRAIPFKDFSEYAEWYYFYKTNTVNIDFSNSNNSISKSIAEAPLRKFGLVSPSGITGKMFKLYYESVKYSDEIINEIKNNIKRMVFSSDTLISNKDLKTFDERFSTYYA
jgi:hypothetical protein